MRMVYRIGIDIGGTKMAAAALDAGGNIVAEGRMPTPREYKALLANCRTLVAQLEGEVKETCSVGIGIPGYIVKSTGHCYAPNTPALMDRNFSAELSVALGGRPLRVTNDADCMTLSEAVDGAARGHNIVYGVIMGTGVGGCLVANKRIVTGGNGFTEWGHLPFPWREGGDGLPVKCGCGKTGCINATTSGPGLAYLHKFKTGKDTSGEQIVKMAEQGDAAALATLDHFYRMAAKTMVLIIMMVDPDMIVIGGGLSQLPGLRDKVQKYSRDYALSGIVETKFAVASHGPASGVRGAAWLWND
ncbi:MAG: ROK family protein [Alphaproteobacteria bacterium]|nr:ROK family protein [Alphaproteobacteria bacterium]